MNVPAHIITDKEAAPGLTELLRKGGYSKVAVLTDEHTSLHCLPLIAKVLPQEYTHIEVRSGEEHKNIPSCAHIWEELTMAGFDRKSLLINLGGGVLTDMGGFCAATYKRGIRFINIPTTLLSQVDASVGGKLGIDFMSFKNHIGLFKEATAVLIDARFLQTLSLRELRSGYAEVVKHALIADAGHWKMLRQTHWQQHNWQDIIRHSIAIKQRVVAEDPQEQGLRKILNFGHTIGHAVESYFLEHGPKLLHGEAVALGMVCEAFLSVKIAGLEPESLEEICRYITQVWQLPHIPEEAFGELSSLALQDKKNEKGVINCTLLSRPGEAVFNQPIGKEEIREAFRWYNKKGWTEASL